MKDNSYLYGEIEVPEIPNDIIAERIELLKANLDKHISVDWRSRDGAKCNAIIKAIRFWETINDR